MSQLYVVCLPTSVPRQYTCCLFQAARFWSELYLPTAPSSSGGNLVDYYLVAWAMASLLNTPNASISSDIAEQRPVFLQLPAEIRIAVYDLLFHNLTAKITFFTELKTQVRYSPRSAPAITEVCRLLREDAFPILQQKVIVIVHAHHLRTVQQRLAIQGRSTAMTDIAPILTWARRIRFLGSYNIQGAQPILASCRGLRMITIPVNLNHSEIREPRTMDDEICRELAKLVRATIASCTGLEKRVASVEAAMTPWAGGWVRERVVCV